MQAGNDGLVIMPDGTKYVSSVRQRRRLAHPSGQAAELIAQNIPSAASMCYDAGANQLVIPMNANNGLAFIQYRVSTIVPTIRRATRADVPAIGRLGALLVRDASRLRPEAVHRGHATYRRRATAPSSAGSSPSRTSSSSSPNAMAR